MSRSFAKVFPRVRRARRSGADAGQLPGPAGAADRCAHLGGPLHQGPLTSAGGSPCVTCPWHGSTFRLTDGAAVHGPATARQPAFHTRVAQGGMVQVRPADPRT